VNDIVIDLGRDINIAIAIEIAQESAIIDTEQEAGIVIVINHDKDTMINLEEETKAANLEKSQTLSQKASQTMTQIS
jgi:hypothetical protein